MTGHIANAAWASAPDATRDAANLARDASLELSALDFPEFRAAREFLRPNQRIYVSHLPRQDWAQTLAMCGVLAAANFDPVPHIPVRLLKSQKELDDVLHGLRAAGVREPLLISGDYASALGPFSNVAEVLRREVLGIHGFSRVSLAGHPEAHPAVSATVIRQAQIDKWLMGAAMGLEVTFVTQFFFAADPFVQWARDLRSAGVAARLVAGLAGPTSIGKLMRLARRCGVGPSIRALTARPASMLKLLGEHSPDALMRELARERSTCGNLFDGVHLFSFGGFLRTATWLRQYAPTAGE
jgi:methylenetetrahydrofolate reductase (NADPH)